MRVVKFYEGSVASNFQVGVFHGFVTANNNLYANIENEHGKIILVPYSKFQFTDSIVSTKRKEVENMLSFLQSNISIYEKSVYADSNVFQSLSQILLILKTII